MKSAEELEAKLKLLGGLCTYSLEFGWTPASDGGTLSE
jgi:hypothetical protein